jgi:hypothetical protein
MGARPLGAGSVDRFISSREVSHRRVVGVPVEDRGILRESEKDGLTFGGIDLYSPMVGPLLDAVKLFLDDARGFLAASLGAPDGRVVREHSRLGPLDV